MRIERFNEEVLKALEIYLKHAYEGTRVPAYAMYAPRHYKYFSEALQDIGIGEWSYGNRYGGYMKLIIIRQGRPMKKGLVSKGTNVIFNVNKNLPDEEEQKRMDKELCRKLTTESAKIKRRIEGEWMRAGIPVLKQRTKRPSR